MSKVIFLLTAFVVLGGCQQSKKCCDSYDKSQLLCLTCPDGAYYYGNNCIMDLEGCAQYSDCFNCSQCADGFKQVEKMLNGIKTNRCQRSSVQSNVGSRLGNDNSNMYTVISTSSKQDPLYDSFLVADDYMKSFHKQIKNASVLSAYKKKTDASADIIEIDYEAPGDGVPRYFRTAMAIDLQKYEFKEVSFAQLSSSDIRKDQTDSSKGSAIKVKQPIDISACLGAVTKNGDSTQKLLDLRESANLKIVQIVDLIARGSSSAFKKIVSVKIISSKDKIDLIELVYQTNEDYNHAFLIDPLTRKVLSINGGSVIKALVATNEAGPIINKPQIPNSVPKQNINRSPYELTAPVKLVPIESKNQNIAPSPQEPSKTKPDQERASTPPAFLKSVESLQVNQPSGFADNPPTSSSTVGPIPSAAVSSNAPIQVNPAASIPKPTQVSTKADQVSKQAPNLSNENQKLAQTSTNNVAVQLTLGTTTTSTATKTIQSPDSANIWPKSDTAGLTQENNMDLLKDLRFLMAKDMINKNLQGYQDLLPMSCYSKTDTATKSFLMTFVKAEGYQTQVMATVALPTFVASISYEHQVSKAPEILPPSEGGARAFKPKDLSQLTKISYYISAAVAIEKVNSNYCAGNLITAAINENDPNIIYFKTTYNLAGRTWEVESSTKKKLRIGQFISEKDITPANKVIIKTPDTPGPLVSTTVPSAGQVGETDKPPAPVEKKEIPKPDASTQSILICQAAKTAPKPDDLLKFSNKNQELSQNILNEIGGFTQVVATAARADVNFLKVEAYSECTSMKILKDGQIVAVFSKVVGFSVQFKIFYETSKKSLFQMYAALDRLKNKIYIINFNQLTFGASG